MSVFSVIIEKIRMMELFYHDISGVEKAGSGLSKEKHRSKEVTSRQ